MRLLVTETAAQSPRQATVWLIMTFGKNKMTLSPTNWRAEFEGSILHISGVAKYPNDFSTAGLERLKDDEPRTLCYRLIFNRDKEPYCDLDGIGPVHHFERSIPSEAKSIRVFIESMPIDFPITQK